MAETEPPPGTTVERVSDPVGETIIPLLAEEAVVLKQTVETGRVQVTRVTHEREQFIDEELARERVEIERIPIGRQVDSVPAMREEGEIIVIPVVEEVLVVERRLLLKEEVRIRRVRTTEKHQEAVSLRHQEAVVTRIPTEAPVDESIKSGISVQSNQKEGAR